MNDITLGGCSPTPLAGYLKALGVLRLLSARHPETRAAWRNESLLLQTPLTREQMEQFFLHNYQPTPVMAPWNGGSGFFEKDDKIALKAILDSNETRLGLYRDCLHISEHALAGMDRSASPKDDAKALLLTRLRGLLPDEALAWLDAAVLLTEGKPQYPPLLGTGGNDGRLDFTNNFMQHLVKVLSLDGKNAKSKSQNWLELALFGNTSHGLVEKMKIGQFSPGQAGGPNATSGFKAEPVINPWDFVLMIEGSLLFAAAAVRRNADDPDGVLSYPFTVRAVSAGFGSLGEGDASDARARHELWMPLWDKFASYAEIRVLLSEGRVALGRKPARDALDFIRAIHHLGSYRGIHSFQRYGLLKRRGDAYLAAPLERIEVTTNPAAKLLDDLDRNNWLEKFRAFAQKDEAANRFHSLRRRLENAIFDFSGEATLCSKVQEMLVLLGEIQSALASSSKAREAVNPLPLLSGGWIQAANDHTPAFRIARALAGLYSGDNNLPLPLRAQLFPVHPEKFRWKADTDRDDKLRNDPYRGIRVCTRVGDDLPRLLCELLDRRLLLAEKLELKDKTSQRVTKPLESSAGATLMDIATFLQNYNDNMDRRIVSLLRGLSLCRIPVDNTTADENSPANDVGSIPAAFALLRLCFIPDALLRKLENDKRIPLLDDDERLPVPPGILAQLASGHKSERAVLTAWRRLHASGLNPVFSHNTVPTLDGISAQRVAAALLIPLRYGAYSRLARCVLKKTSEEASSPAA